MDFGILIPIMALGIPFFAIWIKHREKMIDKQVGSTAAATAEQAAQYASHVKELEQRVQVLERIVTDRGYDVATQIEALRDTQRVEELLDTSGSGVPLHSRKQERA